MTDHPHQTTSGSRKGKRFVYIVASIAGLGGLLFGYDTGVISGAILFIKQAFHLSGTMQEIVVSVVLMGAVVGAAIGGPMADRWGRRRSILIAAVVFAAGAVGTALVPDVTWLLIGRAVVGIAIGIASVTTPLYLSEISPANVRGSLVSFNQLAITVGILAAYLVDYALSSARAWRWMFGLAAVPATGLFIGMLFMPRSPRWLISKGVADKAKSILQRIRGTSQVDKEVDDIRKGLRAQAGGWRELLKPTSRMPLFVGIALAVFQQATGINTVIYYSPTIFQFAGYKSAGMAILATVAVGSVNMGMTIVAIFLLDRVGRRPLLLWGLPGMILGLTVLGLAFYLHQLSRYIGYVAIGSLIVYIGSFAISLGPAFWLLISEIYPLAIRGTAMGIATIVNWGINLLVALTFISLTQAIGRPETFWLYAAVGVGAWFFIYYLVPETKGRTLEEIEEHWRAGKHPREMGKQPHTHH